MPRSCREQISAQFAAACNKFQIAEEPSSALFGILDGFAAEQEVGYDAHDCVCMYVAIEVTLSNLVGQFHLVREQVEDRGEGVRQAREGVGRPAHQTREGLAVESRKCMYDNYLCLCVCVVKTHT